MKIVDVRGREILDSRGNPTVEVEVTLENGGRVHRIALAELVDERVGDARTRSCELSVGVRIAANGPEECVDGVRRRLSVDRHRGLS